MDNKEGIDFGNRVSHLFKEFGVSADSFAKKWGISRATVYNIFTSKSISKPHACILSKAFGQPLEYFGHPSDDLVYVKENKSKLLSYTLMKEEDKTGNFDYLDYLTVYFEALVEVIKKAKDSIVMLDYLGNNWLTPVKAERNEDTFQFYKFHDLYKVYLHDIAKVVKAATKTNPKFEYTRICQLPIHWSADLRSIDKDEKDLISAYQRQAKETVLENIYKNTIEHYEYLRNSGISAKLYAMPRAIRPFSFIIIDNKIIASEYDKIDKTGEAYSDLLFIEEGHLADRMIKTYTSQKEQFDKNLIDIDRSEAEFLLENVKSRLEKELEKSLQEFSGLEKDLDSEERSNEQLNFMLRRNRREKIRHLKKSIEQTRKKLAVIQDNDLKEKIKEDEFFKTKEELFLYA